MQLVDVLNSSVENVSKLIFREDDNPVMEVSIIRKGDGKDILCIPTQTNCKMGCKFCHLTGLDIPSENLPATQIVKLVNASINFSPPQNDTLLISYMGVGEPLLNITNVIESAISLRDNNPYKKIRFGISTLIPGVKPFLKLIESVNSYKLDFKLHWSLHSAQMNVRKSLMPSAINIQKGAELCQKYLSETGQPVEIHYTLIDGINDQTRDIRMIESILDRRFVFKILKFAPHKLEPELEGSNKTLAFKKALESSGFTVEVYSPPGRDIGSSCGQFILDQYTK